MDGGEQERIVSLAPSNTEILYRIGCGDRIVATTSLCDHPEEAAGQPSVGGWLNPDINMIDGMEPDLVLASDMLQDDVVAVLEDRGLMVRQFTPTTLEEVIETFRELGSLLSTEREAERLVRDFRRRLEEVDLGGTRIYCEEWSSPPMASGNWVAGLVREAGGEYPLETGSRSREVDIRELAEFDPEIIFLNVCGAGEGAVGEDVLKRDGWDSLTAVREGNVHVVDDSLLNRPGPRLVDGLERMEEAVQR